MARFLMSKVLGTLRPIDGAGEEAMRGIGNGEIVAVEIKRPRNIKHLQKYWVLMTVVHDNLPEGYNIATKEILSDRLKVAVGHCDEYTLPDGRLCVQPRSIAVSAMEQLDFNAFYDRICNKIAEAFLPGVVEEDLKAEVEALIGISQIGAARPARARRHAEQRG